MESNCVPFLSIITINYNNAEGLRKTIESVKCQTSKDYEHIIVDGGSSDSSVSIIEEFLADEEYAKQVSFWCSEKDRGIYDAMNKGIPHANGKYCLFLNSGDYLAEKDIFEKICINSLNEDIVYFNTNYIYPSKNRTEKKLPPKELTAVYLFYRGMINHQSMIIRTELQKKHLYNLDYKIAADRFFVLTALISENCSTRYINLTLCDFEAENGLSSRETDLLRKESGMLVDIFFPKRIQESLALLEDYENGYKGILKKIRNILLFVAKHTFRRKR